MKTTLATAFLLACILGAANAQSAQGPAFEVASIKETPPELPTTGRLTARPIGLVTQDPSFVSYRNITLKALLMRAYGLEAFQVVGPDWIDSEHYDINAKLPAGTKEDQIPAMLQRLLTDRFRVMARWDTKEATEYTLVTDKGGPKLTLSADQTLLGDQPDKARSVDLPAEGPIKLEGAPVSALARTLSAALAQRVNDATGLEGRYDITLNLSPRDMRAARQAPSPSASDDGGYTPTIIFDAVRDLGLRLVPQKVEVKHLTVVKADRIPTPN